LGTTTVTGPATDVGVDGPYAWVTDFTGAVRA